jgi:phosphate/sulfate permease
MPDIYLIIVVLLFALAISDLVVGVSNDAVNFLNSAVGSKVAPRHIIMIVASLGIFVGATFSSGMMEIARKGIFNPDLFVFAEVMVIFLAVMLTDIILLDLFNTFGMPTSTTVSIIFELLGASVAVALIKIMAADQGFSAVSEYINTASALAIVSGILISVGVAFTVGALVQYLARLLFSFHYEQRLKWVGSLYGGLALSVMTYFLILKGLKGASFVSADFVQWAASHTLMIVGGAFVFWSALMQVLMSVFKVNVLRVVVLFGTFSLAMAFAGNDLVNFIGVPIAGFESFLAWSRTDALAEEYGMGVLAQPVRTNTYLLLLAGAIMIVTLWLSRKARSVTETEVKLGRQDEGSERFEPNLLSRYIVRYTRQLGKGVALAIPRSWMDKAEQSFLPMGAVDENGKAFDPPDFDLVRASVNLAVASTLIAFATSLKLPLSTTYVSFMVAMGTSLSDRAWGRDSAVYRVAGVLNVIGGWFLTAFIAFTVSATFAWLIYHFGIWAIAALLMLVVGFIVRTFLLHRKRERLRTLERKMEQAIQAVPAAMVLQETYESVIHTLSNTRSALHDVIFGLLQEDILLIGRAEKLTSELKKSKKTLKKQLYNGIRRIAEEHTDSSRVYLLVFDLEQDLLQSISFVIEECRAHVQNDHKPLSPEQGKKLYDMQQAIGIYFEEVQEVLKTKEFKALDHILAEKRKLFIQLERLISQQVEGIRKEEYGRRNSMLYFSLLLELKDLIAVAARFAKLYERAQRALTIEKGTPLVAGKPL